MHVIYDNNSIFSHPNLKIKSVNNSTDYAGKIKVDDYTQIQNISIKSGFLATIIVPIVRQLWGVLELHQVLRPAEIQ